MGGCRTRQRLGSTFRRKILRGPVASQWGWGQDVVGGKPAKKLSVVLEEDVWYLAEKSLSRGRDFCLAEDN